MIITLAVLLWWAIGLSGFVYWWTFEYDLTIGEFVLACFIGLMGPLSWLVGCGIHGDHSNPRVVFKRRN